MFRVNPNVLTFDDVALTFKSITMSKCRGDARKKIKRNTKNSNMNPKKPDQIRSTMASVGTEPGRVTRDVTSV